MINKRLINEISRELIINITGLGGFPFYIFLTAIVFFLDVKLSAQLLLGLILCFVFVVPLRVVFYKERPNKRKYKGIIEKSDAGSFPSMHALRTTVLAIILAMFFDNLYINLILGVVVVLVASSRILLKKHHFSDVLFGILFGVALGLLAVYVGAMLF